MTLSVLLPLFLGCTPGKVVFADDTAASSGPDDSGETDADADADADTDADADSDTDTTLPSDDLFSNVRVEVHAEQTSLLVVRWTQALAADVHLEFSFEDGVWLDSPTRSLGSGEHEEYIAGAPYGSAVTWRLVGEPAGDPVLTADVVTENGGPPDELPSATVLVSDPSGWDAEGAPYMFMSLAADDFDDRWWILIVDRAGEVVWSRKSDRNRASLHPRVARDGRSLYIDQNSFWAIFDSGVDSTIQELALDGSLIQSFDTPGLHHPFTDLPDGSVSYGAISGYYSNEYLTHVSLDGERTDLWDCEDWLSSIGERDYCGSNTLTYDEGTDRYLFSFYSFETIVQLTGEGEAVAWFGNAAGSYAFDPESSRFWWQHGGVITPSGTLLTSTDLTTRGVETVVREYEIDVAAETLREVWSFGVGEGVYGEQMGEATRLANGNTWHNYGLLPRVREVTPAGELVWDISWRGDAIGRTMPVSDLYALLPDRL